MATGGAWQSETFDNGRDFQKPAQQPYVTQETPPPMYNAPVSSTQAADRGVFGVLALALRVAQVVLTLIAFTIMASNRQYYYYYHYDVKFSNVKAFTGVVAVNCIVCFYAIVQLVHSFVNYSTQASFVSSATTGFALITFFFDLVLASALIAAAAAGADSAARFSKFDFTKFMQKAQASVVMTFVAFAVLAVSAALYPIRLRKLALTS